MDRPGWGKHHARAGHPSSQSQHTRQKSLPSAGPAWEVPSPPSWACLPAAGREGHQEGLGLPPSLAPDSSQPYPHKGLSCKQRAGAWPPRFGHRAVCSRKGRRLGLGSHPAPHPKPAGNTYGGGHPASLPKVALGKDSWSQTERLAGPMVSQGSCNQTLGQFHHSSPAGLGLWAWQSEGVAWSPD